MIDLAESARHTKFQLRFWLPIGRIFTKILLFCLGPLKVRGNYRVPKAGGLLILANHLADIDPVVVQSACPRAIHFMAKSELFEMKIIGRMQRAFGSFPVKRGTADRAALKLAAQLLQDGEAVCLFPEGQLSETGELQEIKGGVALIIRMALGVPVICCGLQGTNRIIPYGKMIPRPAFHTVDAVWGEPRVLDKSTSNDDILGWISSELKGLSDTSV